MNWINTLNDTLDYIEDNLLNGIDNKKICDNNFVSSFHFQRVFAALANVTLGEYIRNRKLTLAGQELLTSELNIAEIAYKYGYSAPESFSRAFKRFHGVSPFQAKKGNCILKDYNRLRLKVSLTGGELLEYKIVKKNSLMIAAQTIPFTGDFMEQDIARFTKHYFNKNEHKNIVGISVCNDLNDDIFEYGLGYLCDHNQLLKKGYKYINIPPFEWIVFKCKGSVKSSVDSTWQKIYTEWALQSTYEPVYKYELEIYPAGDRFSDNYECEIHLPIKRKGV